MYCLETVAGRALGVPEADSGLDLDLLLAGVELRGELCLLSSDIDEGFGVSFVLLEA